MKIFKKIYLGLLLFSLLGGVGIGFSQVEAQINPVSDNTTSPCFDYYPYSALNITASLDKSSYNPGENASLRLLVANQHPKTSLQNAAIIFQLRKPRPETNTSIILQEIKLKEGLNYPVGQAQENVFSINLPIYLSEGFYEGYIYITENGYSIAGLPFTQDVAGGFVAFKIINPNQKDFIIPYFEEEKALINGIIKVNPFNPPPTINENNLPISISIPIFNPGQKSIESRLDATLYYWDESGEKINSFSENLTLSPKQSYKFLYTAPKSLKAGTYMLESILTSGGATVTSKIRFSLPGFAPRIYYSGVAQEAGKNIFFACVGNVADSKEEDKLEGAVKILVLDREQGNKIDEFNYAGTLFSATQPSLYQKELVNSPDVLTLRTEIFDAVGNLIQQKEINYQFRQPSPIITTVFSHSVVVITLILILILLMVLLILFRFWKQKKGFNSAFISLPLLVLLGLVIFILAFSYLKINNKSAADTNPYSPSGLSNSWSGEINKYRITKGHWAFVYANMAVDFILPETPLSPEESFEIYKGNYGSYYTIYKSYDSPLFWFSDKMILGSQNIDLSSQVAQANNLSDKSQIINNYIPDFRNYFMRVADEIIINSASSTVVEQVRKFTEPIDEWVGGVNLNAEAAKNSAQQAKIQPYETIQTTEKVGEVNTAANNVAYFTDYFIQGGSDLIQLIGETYSSPTVSEFKDQLSQLNDANSELGEIIEDFQENPDNISYSYTDKWIIPNSLISCQTKDALTVQCTAASDITRPITTILTLNRTFKFPEVTVTINQTHPISIVPVGLPTSTQSQPIPSQPLPAQPILRVSPSSVVMFKNNVKEFFAYFDPDGSGPLVEVDVTHVPETQWTSLNPDIIQILSTTSGPAGGKEVKALKSGNAKIKVSFKEKEAYALITVRTMNLKEVSP